MLPPLWPLVAYTHLMMCCSSTDVAENAMKSGIFRITRQESHQESSAARRSPFVVYTTRVKSRLGCARRCFADAECRAFAFAFSSTEGGHDGFGSCRAELTSSAGVTSSAEVTSPYGSMGAQTYRLIPGGSWLEKNCMKDADCATPQSLCFKGQCLCQPGMFFSQGSNTCVTSCDKNHLQDSFVTYVDTGLNGLYPSSSMYASLDSCKRDCLIPRSTPCPIIIYWKDTKCESIQPSVIRADSWNFSIPDQLFLQRVCA
ncbi:hypothetical protein ACOMHN_027652 [Nucella lapillus]